MKKNKVVIRLLCAFSLAAVAGVAVAHHSFSMFDRETQQVITGTVARWAFNNPHSWLYLNVKNEDGSGETLWSFEGAAPPQLIGRGITGNSFKPGDTLTLMYCPLADGRQGGAMGWVKVDDTTFLIAAPTKPLLPAGKSGLAKASVPTRTQHCSSASVVACSIIAQKK